MVRRYLHLTRAERQLLPRLLALVVVVRAALWIVPLDRLQRRLARHGRPWLVTKPLAQSFSPARLAWAVVAVSRRVPDASCLTQALALQFLLARSGRTSRLHIGVAHSSDGKFGAHAWIECEGQLLTDKPETIARYGKIASWEATPSGCTILARDVPTDGPREPHIPPAAL